MKKYILIAFVLLVFTPFLTKAKEYKGAELRTNESFLYGRFEVSMKSAEGSGLVSSFLLSMIIRILQPTGMKSIWRY
ncbi:MAG: family 16 glycosylhydrolase [Sporocytophaga sp.]|nr:family 16 glycosylhydrolase [Sporocytophaga sp.]